MRMEVSRRKGDQICEGRLTRTWILSPIALNDHVGDALCQHGLLRHGDDICRRAVGVRFMESLRRSGSEVE